jgi:non-heme chloroperoxidase
MEYKDNFDGCVNRLMNMKESDLKTVGVNGTQLHYMVFGDNNKQSVIFTPAAFTDYRVWQFQVEPFSRHYRVITYSRRHSYPNKVEDNFHFTAENSGVHQYAYDLAELIRKLNLAPAHLVGHSDGGFVTLYCACRNPSLAKAFLKQAENPMPMDFNMQELK